MQVSLTEIPNLSLKRDFLINLHANLYNTSEKMSSKSNNRRPLKLVFKWLFKI